MTKKLLLLIIMLTGVHAFHVAPPMAQFKASHMHVKYPSNTYISVFKSQPTNSKLLRLFQTDVPIERVVPNVNVVVKVWKVLKATITQGATGYISGYLISYIYGFFQGYVDQARCGRWGMMFAPISVIYGGCDAVALEFFGASAENLWNAVMKSILAGLFFGRAGGLSSMLRNAALYGGMTYYMTKSKLERDSQTAAEQQIGQKPPALDVDFEVMDDKGDDKK